MNIIKPLLLSACYLFTYQLSAQLNPIEFEEFDLENGLHVILHQDNSTPIVAVSVMYHVGSKNEDPERTGFAHFFEHLLFEGSENIGRGEYAKYVERAGGAINANTSPDRTYYYEILPSNQLELGLWLESERMLHAAVDQKGVDTQREVVKEERRETVDNRPYGSLLEESLKRAFTKHPYQWGIIGSMDHLNNAEESDYQQFYKDFYVPNNATLSIAGDIDLEECKAFIAKYFTDIPKGDKPIFRPNIVEPPLSGEVSDTIYDNIQLPAVIQTYRIPAQGTPDYYAVSMLAQLMSQGQSSRLYRALVDEQQKALQVVNIPIPMEDPGVAIQIGIANMGVDPAQLEAAMDEEMVKVQHELISEKEFTKLKNQIENTFISSNTRMANIAENLANYHVYFGDADLINTEIDRYLAVTREDLQRVAKKYFTPDNRVSLKYLPKQATP